MTVFIRNKKNPLNLLLQSLYLFCATGTITMSALYSYISSLIHPIRFIKHPSMPTLSLAQIQNVVNTFPLPRSLSTRLVPCNHANPCLNVLYTAKPSLTSASHHSFPTTVTRSSNCKALTKNKSCQFHLFNSVLTDLLLSSPSAFTHIFSPDYCCQR